MYYSTVFVVLIEVVLVLVPALVGIAYVIASERKSFLIFKQKLLNLSMHSYIYIIKKLFNLGLFGYSHGKSHSIHFVGTINLFSIVNRLEDIFLKLYFRVVMFKKPLLGILSFAYLFLQGE